MREMHLTTNLFEPRFVPVLTQTEQHSTVLLLASNCLVHIAVGRMGPGSALRGSVSTACTEDAGLRIWVPLAASNGEP